MQGPHTPTAGVVSLALAVLPQNGSVAAGELPVVHDVPEHYTKTFSNASKLRNIYHIIRVLRNETEIGISVYLTSSPSSVF